MAWPFPQYIRPLMRDILWWEARGLDFGQVYDKLVYQYRHDPADVMLAAPEAQRARLFGEVLANDTSGLPVRALWQENAYRIFVEAYGREPTAAEAAWATSQPGGAVGVMWEVTLEGMPGFRITPTMNVDWNMSMEDAANAVFAWLGSGLQRQSSANAVSRALASGAIPQIRLIGGALVPRNDPTIEG